ncbi:histone deacetylase complex protein [Cytidiella melzeri]|nr:histone deacetylase complex protein [Cytidiella melzeri]
MDDRGVSRSAAASLHSADTSELIHVGYVVSNDLAKISSLLPSNINRSLLVHSLVKQYGLLNLVNPWSSEAFVRIICPTPATPEDLTTYHTRRYIEFVLNAQNFSRSSSANSSGSSNDLYAEYGIEEDCPAFASLPHYVRLVGGATMAAANALVKDEVDIAICWDGGRKSKASGFCYVADCVLAILLLKKDRIIDAEAGPRKARVMYLDLDLHFSDGVSQAFYSPGGASNEPQVLTLSIHHTSLGFFPVSQLSSLSDCSLHSFDPFTLSLPLARGASDATFARIWESVESIKNAFRPDYVVVQCGVDGLAGDPYAVWNWSLGSSEGSLSWCLSRILHVWQCKTLLVGGGGYNHPNAARAWTHLTSLALRKPLPMTADIPDHPAFPLYAPSFTLDVPPGHSQDLNTDAYLSEVETRFAEIADIIWRVLGNDEVVSCSSELNA